MPDPTSDGPSLDSLVPAAMARRAEEIGEAKATMLLAPLIPLSLGGRVHLAGGGVLDRDSRRRRRARVTRLLAGVAFSLGLILVVVGGAELFTGNNLIVMAWASGGEHRALARNWASSTSATSWGRSRPRRRVRRRPFAFGGGAVGAGRARHGERQGRGSASARRSRSASSATRSCASPCGSLSARTTADRILAIIPPISAFVAGGFEHSVANMYFIPEGCSSCGPTTGSGHC